MTELSESFKKLLEDHDLNILQEEFFDIIECINTLSQKSDEFRYITDVAGKYNLPQLNNKKEPITTINLIVLCQYLNYIYLHLHSLFFVLKDNEDSVLTDTIFCDPYVKGLLYGVVHSNISKTCRKNSKDKSSKAIKNFISSIITNNDLQINAKDIKVDKSDDGYQVSLNDSVLFTIFEKDKSWFLKTPPLTR